MLSTCTASRVLYHWLYIVLMQKQFVTYALCKPDYSNEATGQGASWLNQIHQDTAKGPRVQETKGHKRTKSPGLDKARVVHVPWRQRYTTVLQCAGSAGGCDDMCGTETTTDSNQLGSRRAVPRCVSSCMVYVPNEERRNGGVAVTTHDACHGRQATGSSGAAAGPASLLAATTQYTLCATATADRIDRCTISIRAAGS